MKVQVKHVIALEPMWLDTFVAGIIAASKTVYPSEVEEMAVFMAMIEPEVQSVADKSFHAGKRVGMMDE